MIVTRTDISGAYVRANEHFLREKAGRNDPRNVFYRAMLENDTYEAYLARVGSINVEIPGLKTNPINGRMEILYARRNGWVEDSKG